MKIKMTSVYVDDQEQGPALLYRGTGALPRRPISVRAPYRWLTVVSPEEPDGTELQLALNNNPAAKAYQQAICQQSQPAAMFYTITYD